MGKKSKAPKGDPKKKSSKKEGTSRNISTENRNKLKEEIKRINGLSDKLGNKEGLIKDKELQDYIEGLEDLKIELQKLLRAKKYGLVFEEHREEIDDKLTKYVPVIKEKEELRIDKKGAPVNFLIEGDNLASLQLLKMTHEGKIDLIYIDPPYNTKKKEFVYGDTRIGENDLFRHSKWLSFMSKRLRIARELLSEEGLIFISIDDHEQAPLKLLCNEIFGEDNFLSLIVWNKNSTTVMLNKGGFSTNTEYILLYKKSNAVKLKNNDISKKLLKSYNKDDNDGRGKYRTVNLYTNTNTNKRVSLKMPDGTFFEAKWQVTQEKFDDYVKQGLIVKTPSGWRKKIYLSNCEGSVPVTMLDPEIVGTTKTGTGEIQSLFDGKTPFPYPKPTTLVKYLIGRYPKKDITILDFFAGSGTTGEAVMRLNREDGGKRRFILCTNNEGGEVREEDGICRKITYERLRRVIEGEYKGVDKDKVRKKDKDKYKPYDVSLKYFQIDFVPNTYPLTEVEKKPKRKFYLEYAGELLKYVRSLVELENAINSYGNEEIAIIQTEKQLNDFVDALKKSTECKCKTVYLSYKIFLSGANYRLFLERGIEDENIKRIPDYYSK